MLPPFDIFRREPDGGVLWIRSAESFKAARMAVKELMASSPHEYLIYSHRTNNRLIVKPGPLAKRKGRRVIFQIAYDELLMESRAKVLEADGFAVVSVLGNEAAKAALQTPQDYCLFMLGHGASPSDRKHMADWLKGRFPDVPILALNPPYQQELKPADYNIILNGPEEWLFVVEATTA